MKKSLIILIIAISGNLFAQENKTDISLQWKDGKEQVTEIQSETGDLYRKLKHHGPAVENEWVGYRLYFDKKVSVDIYNKEHARLELAEGGWYPSVDMQKEGWGADQYKVGPTMGCGGVRLWDGEKEVLLDPVSMRTARVRKEGNISYMEMLSEGVEYKGEKIDILVRLTVYSGMREAKVEAFAFSTKPVQFLTGLNYWPTTETKQGDDYVCAWGVHPEDVAAFQVNIGSAVIYNPDDYAKIEKTDNVFRMISKPTKYLETWVTSACEREDGFKNAKDFFKYVEGVSEK